MHSLEYQSLLEIWRRMLKFAQIPIAEIESTLVSYGRNVALLSPQNVESIVIKGGFESPILFYQILLVRAWYAKRTV